MIGEAERILGKLSGMGDSVEVVLHRTREYSVRIESGRISMPEATEEGGVGVRVIVAGSEGFSHSNRIGDYESVAETARKIASLLPPKGASLPEPGRYAGVDNYDPEIEAAGPETAVEIAKEIIDAASAVSKEVVVDMGLASLTVSEFAVVNTEGLSFGHRSTGASYMALAFARRGERVSSFDYRAETWSRLSDLDVEDTLRDLAEQVLMSVETERLGGFRGPVMLSPEAFSDLVGALARASSADNVLKGRSPLSDKLGKKAFFSNLTVIDDGLRPDSPVSSPGDREGSPRRVVEIVRDGVLKEFLHSHYTAVKMGQENNGHAISPTTIPRVGPTNVVVIPGDASKEELLESAGEVLFVSRLSATTDYMGNLSGTVKGGWLVRKGEWVKAVREVQVTGNVFEALGRIRGIAREARRVASHSLPFVLLEGLSVTG